MLRPYVELFQHNPKFRRLFAALSLSQLGDWFNLIALFTLLRGISVDPVWGIASLFIIKQLPAIFVTAYAGRLADRLPRKQILISCDLLRAGLLAVLLMFSSSATLPLVLTILILHSLATAFSDPTIQAFIPDVVAPKDIISAQAMRSIVWTSTMILGAFLGGIVTEYLSWQWAISIDIVTFLGAATLVSTIHLHPHRPRPQKSDSAATHLSSLAVWRNHPRLRLVLLARPTYGLGAAMYVVLTLTGQDVAQSGSNGALAVGLLYMARGCGALLGPILIRALIPMNQTTYRRAIYIGFAGTAAGWLLFGTSTSFVGYCAAAFIAHFSGQLISAFAFTVLQLESPPEIRGQVFGLENMLFSLAYVGSIVGYGYLLSSGLVSLRYAALLLGTVWLVPTGLWFQELLRIQKGIADASAQSKIERTPRTI